MNSDPRDVDDLLVGSARSVVSALVSKSSSTCGVAVPERIVGDEAVADVRLLLADDAAELERQRGRDRDGARDLLVVVRDLGLLPWTDSTRPTTLLA